MMLEVCLCLQSLVFYFTLINGKSFFERELRFENKYIQHSSLRDVSSVPLPVCARYCHGNEACLSFVHNRHDGRCQLFSKLFFSQLADVTQTGNVMFRKTDVEVVCPIPDAIPKGRILNVDGQKEGSKASFACDDFYIPYTLHGICGSDGIWDGFTCGNGIGPPYTFLTMGRLTAGRCAILPAITPNVNSRIYLYNAARTSILLLVTFDLTTEAILRNSWQNGAWGTVESSLPFWPLEIGRDVNLTLCTEDTLFRMYVDTVEMFTFNRPLPPTDAAEIQVWGFTIKGVFFTE